MIGQTERGSLIEIDPEMAVSEVEKYLNMPDMWLSKAQKGMAWAREYTLERFDNEIKKLII